MSDKCTKINFIAVGSGKNNFAYSNDGIKWISGNTQVFSNAYGIINIPSTNYWLAFGEGGHNSTGETQSNIFRTYDGKKWNTTQNTFFSAKRGACYNTFCVAIGTIKNPYGNSSTLSRSQDSGTTWLDNISVNLPNIGNDIAFNKISNMWIVVGSDSSNNNFSYSYSNGTDTAQYAIKWFPGKIDIGEINGIATNNLSTGNLWVAIGNRGTAYSSNGVTWTTVVNNILFSNPKAIACNGSIWVAVGSDSKSGNCIAYSNNGINWTYATNIFSKGAQGITWNDDNFLWVAVGSDSSNNTIAYSKNAKDWTMVEESKFFENGAYGVASKNK